MKSLQQDKTSQVTTDGPLVTIPINLGLKAVLIFRFGLFPRLEVAGTAWGTTIANMLAACAFGVICSQGRIPCAFR